MKLKKIAAFLLLAGMMSSFSAMAAEAPAKEEPGTWTKIGRAIVFYIPNLLADICDVVSVEFNVGNSAAADVHVTRYLDLGFEKTDSYFIGTNTRHRFGAGRREAKMFNLGCFSYDDLYVSETCGNFEDYILKNQNFNFAEYYLDAYRNNNVNFWSIGFRAGFIFGVAVDLNLQAIPDVITGIFFYDLSGDNWK